MGREWYLQGYMGERTQDRLRCVYLSLSPTWPESPELTPYKPLRHVLAGSGIYEWFDGHRFSGMWKDTQQEGQGVYEWSDGRKYDGEWSGNVFSHPLCCVHRS
jgi:hypothetical protein